jgi:hypothetical protein
MVRTWIDDLSRPGRFSVHFSTGAVDFCTENGCRHGRRGGFGPHVAG